MYTKDAKIAMFKRFFSKPTPAPPPDETPRTLPADVTDGDFAARVLGAQGLVVVDFWAEWCQPCTVMSAFVEFLARDFAGALTVFALDTDENPKAAEQHTVMSLPTLLFFRDGIEIHRTVGVTTYDDLKRQVARLV